MAPIDLAIVGGTGIEGRGLALRLAGAGARVTIGSRDAGRAAEVARRLRELLPVASIEGASNAHVITTADVVVLAVPFAHAASTIAEHRSAFRPDALVIDVTVPVAFVDKRPTYVDVPEGSAAEHVRHLLPDRVRLACAFKTLPARLLEHHHEPLDCDDFVCGDSPASREQACALVESIRGLRAIDAGPLESARVVERMTVLAILLNRHYKSHDARFRVIGV